MGKGHLRPRNNISISWISSIPSSIRALNTVPRYLYQVFVPCISPSPIQTPPPLLLSDVLSMSTDLNELSFPSEAERELVANRVAQRLERIAVLRREIAQLTKENTQDRFYISTHRLLPREVLGEIFVHAAIWGSGAWLAPMVMSQVSRHWRNVVRSTPRAWSFICIRITPNLAYSQLVKTWLAQSGQSLLHLRFETPLWGTGTRDAVRQASLGNYLALLQPHVSRWHSVEIFIGDTPHHSIWNIQLLLQQFNFDMPELKFFYLDTTRQLWRDYHVLKGDVPKLSCLSIGHCRPSTSNHWLSHLQELEITNAVHSLYYMHGLLKACPLLTSLKLDVTIQEREVRGLITIKLPHLRQLYLNDILYLSFLRLPSLVSFTFAKPTSSGLQEGNKIYTNLSMMLEASDNYVLQEVNLSDVDIGRFNFTPGHLPSISTTRLTRCTLRPEALENWGEPMASLRTLEFFSCDRLPDTLFALHMKDGVWVSAVRRVVLFDCFGIKSELIDSIRSCKGSPIVTYSASTRTSPRTVATRPDSHYRVLFSESSSTPMSFSLPSLPSTSF
ncbi:hypothetical protein D9756_003328 [Leucocoprinus leucothites]|uniref:F-box domain-containing protein n=1 Tax=Leucocoprinus leucothites TaxID=201217 RepID=A0A8H5LJ00_9AGAR|nr:hypothetical protein D9756_003328 [Leucoagaricus leucothites]